MKEDFHKITHLWKNTQEKTFFNPLGCYKYLRMPFGLPNARETFQHSIEDNFGKTKGVTVFFIKC